MNARPVRRMTAREHEAMMSAEIVNEVRRVAHDVTGGNCAFADSDVGLLGRLATLAIKAGLHNELADLSLQTRRNMDRCYGRGVFAASAIEARQRPDRETGLDPKGESATGKAGDAQ